MNNLSSASLIAFYLGEFPNSEGRLLEDIWAWDYKRLEFVHNYIQWLFPLREESTLYTKAPIADDEVIAAFKEDERLRSNLLKSFTVMLEFYGLQIQESNNNEVVIIKSGDYPQRKMGWVEEDNHNYLRLTRILKSLRLLGLEKYSQALFKCLEQIYNEEKRRIGAETFKYWQDAIH